MSGKSIIEFELHDKVKLAKTVSETDIYLYAGMSGDFNPAHINEEYAKKTFFKTRIAHGMLSAGFISMVIGTKLPGPGTIYLDQSLKYLATARIGDTITTRVEVKEIMTEKNRVRLKTVCINQAGFTVLGGEAVISPPKPG